MGGNRPEVKIFHGDLIVKGQDIMETITRQHNLQTVEPLVDYQLWQNLNDEITRLVYKLKSELEGSFAVTKIPYASYSAYQNSLGNPESAGSIYVGHGKQAETKPPNWPRPVVTPEQIEAYKTWMKNLPLIFETHFSPELVSDTSKINFEWKVNARDYALGGGMLGASLNEKVAKLISTLGESFVKRGEMIISAAEGYLNTKYELGGNTRSGIDCSNLVHKAHVESGFPYNYRNTPTFASSPNFVKVDKPIIGDVILFAQGHMGLFNPKKGNTPVLSATRHHNVCYAPFNWFANVLGYYRYIP
jgi:hypothetical protein